MTWGPRLARNAPSLVRARPPSMRWASSRRTRAPPSAQLMAATSPPSPPPTTVISFMLFKSGGGSEWFREPLGASTTPGDVVELVRRAQLGDTDAMNALLTEIAPYVGRICGAVALGAGEDATQEALVAIFRNLPSLRDAIALRAWARRIAVREALRAAGRNRSVPVDPATLEAAVAAPDLSGSVDVLQVLAGLDPVHRAVLVLRHLDGLGEEEMADVLEVAPGTVKSRLHRARAAFKARWSA